MCGRCGHSTCYVDFLINLGTVLPNLMPAHDAARARQILEPSRLRWTEFYKRSKIELSSWMGDPNSPEGADWNEMLNSGHIQRRKEENLADHLRLWGVLWELITEIEEVDEWIRDYWRIGTRENGEWSFAKI